MRTISIISKAISALVILVSISTISKAQLGLYEGMEASKEGTLYAQYGISKKTGEENYSLDTYGGSPFEYLLEKQYLFNDGHMTGFSMKREGSTGSGYGMKEDSYKTIDHSAIPAYLVKDKGHLFVMIDGVIIQFGWLDENGIPRDPEEMFFPKPEKNKEGKNSDEPKKKLSLKERMKQAKELYESLDGPQVNKQALAFMEGGLQNKVEAYIKKMKTRQAAYKLTAEDNAFAKKKANHFQAVDDKVAKQNAEWYASEEGQAYLAKVRGYDSESSDTSPITIKNEGGTTQDVFVNGTCVSIPANSSKSFPKGTVISYCNAGKKGTKITDGQYGGKVFTIG